MTANPGILDLVERHVNETPSTAKEIWQRVDCWAPQTITNALERLRADGRVVGSVEPIPSGFVRKYARAA